MSELWDWPDECAGNAAVDFQTPECHWEEKKLREIGDARQVLCVSHLAITAKS